MKTCKRSVQPLRKYSSCDVSAANPKTNVKQRFWAGDWGLVPSPESLFYTFYIILNGFILFLYFFILFYIILKVFDHIVKKACIYNVKLIILNEIGCFTK